MRPKVFIDGHAGTTGLRIHKWLSDRDDLELHTLPDDVRKNTEARRKQMLSADVAVLCLPDDEAKTVARWVDHSSIRVIDASTAHRVSEGWVYGLPELGHAQRDAIRGARYVSNPGCYASAFVLLVRPLIDKRILTTDAPIIVHALSGYSGGGHSLIERWEQSNAGLMSLTYEAPYAYDRLHKHIPEMMKFSCLQREPQFIPAVGPFRCGMRVQIPLHSALLTSKANADTVWNALQEQYRNEPFVDLYPLIDEIAVDERTFDPQACNGTNCIQVRVLPHPSGHMTLMAILDNLGKGACGTAIQSLNIMLGFPQDTGLPMRTTGSSPISLMKPTG